MAERATASYDVFLSFRGADTRLGFTGNLYSALNERGIHSFFDDTEIRKGEELTPSLVKAIKESRTAIIVLSKNYAFSSFCLEELSTIVECYKEKKGRVVLPIFHDVDPSDVRHQRGSYGEAMARHEDRFKDNKEKIAKWRMALHHTANISGFHFKHGEGYEYQFIGQILKVVSSKIDGAILHVANYPVGLDSRINQVMSILNGGSDDIVHFLGIHGIGGIGKSTIARAVYNDISDQYEGFCCFLEDVRVKSHKYGLLHLEEMVLSDILGDKDTKLRNVRNGMNKIKQRLCNKKVLLVLDDVDQKEELEAIVGAPDWFGVGSTVIITTRDSGLLKFHQEILTYEVEQLNPEEARELLSWNAFKTNKVDPKYTHILNRAVVYASRLPLALEVIGSALFGKEEEECKLTLDRYDRFPDRKIQDMLRVSFDSLEKDERKTFLDIACCFGGYKLSDVEDILHAHHGSPMKHSISLLIEKSLIKIDDDQVTLHELIQEMGREIVRKESKEPRKRSRLWFYEDVIQVLEGNKGTSKTQILILDIPEDLEGSKGEDVHWDGEAFKKMKNLKTVIVRNGQFSKGPTYFPNTLKVLKWWGYPSQFLPNNFFPERLSILEIHHSRLKSCETIQRHIYLRVLDFGYSKYITEIPDLSGLPYLEKLSFRHCEDLTKIHVSVGYLESLKILDVVSCKKLETFPPIILICLEQLNLSRCSSLKSFPEILGKMEKIKELHITRSPIKELPFSIINLTRLRKLELQLCEKVQLPSSIVMLKELGLLRVSECQSLCFSNQEKGEEVMSRSSNTECLILANCNISDDFFPIGLTWFANVKDLDLSGNNFTNLDSCIEGCPLLRNLKLDECKNLQEFRGIPPDIETFSAKGCTSLKCLDLIVLHARAGECLFLKELILDDCVYLREIKGVLPNLNHFSAKNCISLGSGCTSMLLNQDTVEAGNKMFSLPGTKIPEWFAHRNRGESISFWFRSKFPAVYLCLVIGLMNEGHTTVRFSPRVIINGNKQSVARRKVYEFRIETDHIFLFDIQLLEFEQNMDLVCSEEWSHVEVSYADHIADKEVPIGRVVKHCGIHVLEQTSSNIKFSNPSLKKRKWPDLIRTWKSKSQLSSKEEGRLRGKGVSEFPTQNQDVALFTQHVQHVTEQFSSLPVQATGSVNMYSLSVERQIQIVQFPERNTLKDTTMVLSPPTRSPQHFEAEKDLTSQPTPSVERLSHAELHPTTTIQNDPSGNERCREQEVVSSCELESQGSDSDDPFDQIDKKFSIGGKQQATSAGESFEEESLTSIEEAFNGMELFMVKDLSEVCSDLAKQSGLHQLLDSVRTSSHPKVTTEVKEAIIEFQRKASTSFEEFEATVGSMNKLKNFEKQKARILQKKKAGTEQWKDLKNSIKEVSSAMKTKNSRKKELQDEIVTLRNQLATKERDLEQLEQNFMDQKTTLSTYQMNCDSLRNEAQALSKEVVDLVAANTGVEDEGEAAQVKQNLLKSTWSTDLTMQLNEIKNNVLGRQV